MIARVSSNLSTQRTQLFSSGQCGCLEYDLTEGDDWLAIYDSQGFDDIISDYDNATKRAVIQAVCSSTIFLGDHIGVSACCMTATASPLNARCRSHMTQTGERRYLSVNVFVDEDFPHSLLKVSCPESPER